MGLEITLA